jgi:catechol 2,3-dioxygenase-like lactoylglutathione lyase family enzyme
MSPQISVVTLGVSDLDRAKKFYSEGLGCPIGHDQGGFVSFNLGDGSSALALYTRDALAGDAGVGADGTGFPGFTLSYVVDSNERVDDVIAQAERAGATVIRPAQTGQWGGYFGYFADPDSYLWKVVSSSY